LSKLDQIIEPLKKEDRENLDKARSWVRDHFTPEARHKYELLEEKIRLLQVILDEGWIEKTETQKLQSLGVTLGDMLCEKLGLTWVMVEDEYGRDPAVMVPKTTILAFPLTAISKRVEKGEKVDVRHLFDGFCELIEKRRSTAAQPD
jgi:hypothetical protein